MAAPEDTENLLNKHLQRQQNILQALCSATDIPPKFKDVGRLLEEALFTPEERPNPKQGPDPKLNFFPPFLTPECLALHYPFFLTTSLPSSCKANRIGTETYRQFCSRVACLEEIPEPFKWDDSLGNVSLIAELKENQKLALLEEDTPRLRWVKEKCSTLQSYAYPAVTFPPQVQKILFKNLIGEAQDPNKLDSEYKLAFSDEDFPQEDPKDKIKQRELLGAVATFGALLLSMKRLFTHPNMIKNCQESLHYTFLHGYVQLVHMLTEVNLSEFVTFHGLTHRNRLNNPVQHRQLEGKDRFDYCLDTIYLFLVFTWQTAMDIWGQTIDEETEKSLQERVESLKEKLAGASYAEASELVADAVFPPLLREALVLNIPDFVNQAQLSNFRLFINNKANVPAAVCPTLPSDFVPLAFEESHPVLWGHVWLLRHAAYLLNHGQYAYAPDEASLSLPLCVCNLCSPHRMPCYNPSLMNEILSIGKFEFQGSEEKRFSFTPQVFTNAYMQKFYADDFHPHEVVLYPEDKSKFKIEPTAAVIRDPKLLALIMESQARREKNILKRGGGLYLDPQTGEVLGKNSHVSEELQARADLRQEPGYDIPPHGGQQVSGSGRGLQEARRGTAAGDSSEQPSQQFGRGAPERGRAGRGQRGRGSRRTGTPAPRKEEQEQEEARETQSS